MSYQQMGSGFEAACEVLCKKWTFLIIRALLGGKKRFSEFRQQMPMVSDRLLSERLKELEDQRIITRHVHDTKPVLIEYGLTPRGLALEPLVESIQNWADAWVQ